MPAKTFAIKVASLRSLSAISTKSNQVSRSPRLGLTVMVENMPGPKMSHSSKRVATIWAPSSQSSAPASLKQIRSTLGK